MGWSKGTDIVTGLIEVLVVEVPNEEARVRIYKKVIDVCEDADWDTQGECRGLDPAYDRALHELHPDWSDEE